MPHFASGTPSEWPAAAEGHIGMVKVQPKISGTFRSPRTAADFCGGGYISTVQQHGLLVPACRSQALDGRPFLPH